jgi:hypothetical protein
MDTDSFLSHQLTDLGDTITCTCGAVFGSSDEETRAVMAGWHVTEQEELRTESIADWARGRAAVAAKGLIGVKQPGQGRERSMFR